MKRPAPLRFLWDHHKPTLLLLVLALAVALFFALRFVGHALYWHDLRDANPPIEPWMTPGFIARSWDVPRQDLAQILSTADLQNRPTLAEIAKAQGRPTEDLIAELTVWLSAQKALPQ
ncbi:MAG: hypothetical protein ACRBBS_03885 [Thalassovita sp.]